MALKLGPLYYGATDKPGLIALALALPDAGREGLVAAVVGLLAVAVPAALAVQPPVHRDDGGQALVHAPQVEVGLPVQVRDREPDAVVVVQLDGEGVADRDR